MIYKLNLGRNCLKVIIRTYGIKEIFIPYYSCKTIWQAIREENCRIKFYHIDENFMPARELPKDSYVLYINYFGIFENNCRILSLKYKNLITDNTQGFYAKHYGIASFNSLRKFFPVPNGAYLQIEKEPNLNFRRDNLLIKSANIRKNYEQFKQNELILNREQIKLISTNVEAKMSQIDFKKDKIKRRKRFMEYSKQYTRYNLIKIPDIYEYNIPYCYPFCTNNKKITENLKKHTILRLWDDLPKNFTEYKFLYNVAALM